MNTRRQTARDFTQPVMENWSGHSESTTRQKSQRIGGQRLSPPTKKKKKCCHCAVVTGQTPWVVFTHARTRTNTQSIPARARRGASSPGGSRVQPLTLTGNLDRPAISALNGSAAQALKGVELISVRT